MDTTQVPAISNAPATQLEICEPYGIIPSSDADTESFRNFTSLCNVLVPLVRGFRDAYHEFGLCITALNQTWEVLPLPNRNTLLDAEKKLMEARDGVYEAYNKLNEDTEYGPIAEDSEQEATMQHWCSVIQQFYELAKECGPNT
jgi:hypothetical protein